MATQTVKVPDIGTDDAAEVVEVCVSVGDVLELEQSLIVLETDKASVEVPCHTVGKVISILVNEGDQIKTGAPIIELDTSVDCGENSAEEESQPTQEQHAEASSEPSTDTTEAAPPPGGKAAESFEVKVPDLGGADSVEVIEISVSAGDDVSEGDSLIVIETDKASVDVPSPVSGKVVSVSLSEGDSVKEGQLVCMISSAAAGEVNEPQVDTPPKAAEQTAAEIPKATKEKASQPAQTHSAAVTLPDSQGEVYAGPAVRKLARQLGVDLKKVKGTGPRNRCTKEDLRKYVRDLIADKSSGGIPAIPDIDFSKFGSVKKVKLSKIHRLTASNMQRSWLNVPHVTQFDDADISSLEGYRKSKKADAEQRGIKISPVPFIIKACALALQKEPSFNVSLDSDGEHMYQKEYVHIGMAVDTPAGLVVPVIRDADKKSIWEIAEDVAGLAAKGRDGKLTPRDMQGGCFTVSSLGAIGGQGFTPIVNAPEVGILGVSKASIKPWWNGKEFEPRQMLPLSLSYDHRAVNGANAGRFLTYLVEVLQSLDGLTLE
ncbi:dihydrolipoyllysine-residue acetyltransferase [Aurantivibrio plasticivorans]